MSEAIYRQALEAVLRILAAPEQGDTDEERYRIMAMRAAEARIAIRTILYGDPLTTPEQAVAYLRQRGRETSRREDARREDA